MNELPLFDTIAAQDAATIGIALAGDNRFDGQTIVPALDNKRLTGQWKAVFELISDGKWRTLVEIKQEMWFRYGIAASEAGVSARTRDLRKERYGGHTVNRRRRGAAERGLHEYQLIRSDK